MGVTSGHWQAAGGHVSKVGRVNDNLNLSRAIGDMSYKRNRIRQPKDQIISAEPDVCRWALSYLSFCVGPEGGGGVRLSYSFVPCLRGAE